MNYERRVYGVLDMIGDVGGLNDAFALIFQTLVTFFTGSIAYTEAIPRIFPIYKSSFISKVK